MRTVSKIESQVPKLQGRKRVAAYARVSMECERLQHSLSAQVSYYSKLIQSHPEWEYAGVFADDGISGTSTTKRNDFNRLMAECEVGRIDIILTKSISRFARNTLDILQTVRHLKELGIEVRFEKEGINSLSGDGELMLTLLASFAQEEIRSLSDNVKWGTRKRFEKGMPNGRFRVYGYRWEGNKLVLQPDEAIVIRRIFQEFLDGKSRLETERGLATDGITTANGCRFMDSNIKSILTNCVYTGDMLLQKYYQANPFDGRQRRNNGELPQYLVKDHHEAIISREVFDYVQQEIDRRRELGVFGNKSLNLTCFSTKIKCGICGASYVRSTRHQGLDKHAYTIWVCNSSKKRGRTCGKPKQIPEIMLMRECAQVMGLTAFDEEAFLKQIEKIVVVSNDQLDFVFYDGHIVSHRWASTMKKDCWTPEARAAKSSFVQEHQIFPNSTCFTSRIFCEMCGETMRRQSQRIKGGKVAYWRCRSDKHQGDHQGFREPYLQQITAEMLGIDSFDEQVFRDKVDRMSISPEAVLTIFFKDGSTDSHALSTKRVTPPWSEEQRVHFMSALERRKEQSDAADNDHSGND